MEVRIRLNALNFRHRFRPCELMHPDAVYRPDVWHYAFGLGEQRAHGGRKEGF
jgi:hypothetical protein